MKTLRTIAFFILCFGAAFCVYGLELNNGVRQEFGMSFTEEQHTSLPIVSQVVQATRTSKQTGLSLAFVNIAGSDDWYRLYEDMHIYGVNVSQQKLLGGWLLTRWSHHETSSELEQAYRTFSIDYPFEIYRLNRIARSLGCLSDSPLRYGDIDGDAASDIVLFLDNDFVVFSPDYQRIVFAETLDFGDWVSAEESEEIYQGMHVEGDEQYLSRLAAENDTVGLYGIRGYAKIYFGDFDKDSNPDMLVWRKAYKSRSKKDEMVGFEMLRQEWSHFERDLKVQEESEQGITGEYLPQETDATTIQQWLADNNLTWKKGYPEVSECPGEEGEPIPEMSDPLLNDPEVLQ